MAETLAAPLQVGEEMKSAIAKVRGTQYKSETAAGLYPTTGTSLRAVVGQRCTTEHWHSVGRLHRRLDVRECRQDVGPRLDRRAP